MCSATIFSTCSIESSYVNTPGGRVYFTCASSGLDLDKVAFLVAVFAVVGTVAVADDHGLPPGGCSGDNDIFVGERNVE